MKDVSDKMTTLRMAEASVVVHASKEAVAAAKSGQTPKGPVLEIARSAAVTAAKKTSELIPYCHNIQLDHVEILFEAEGQEIKISSKVKASAKTGVEMEALTSASIAALTVYDMLKSIDDKLTISDLKLVEKRGGKSDFKDQFVPVSAVLVTSDSVSSGKKEDVSGKLIVEHLKKLGSDVKSYLVMADDKEQIVRTIKGWVQEGIQLVVTTGGTGLGPRDVTSDTVKEIIERELPGVAEAIRAHGQRFTPYSMLSRGIAGAVGKTIIVTLPGSSKAVKESLGAIFPYIFHIYPMLTGHGH